MSMTVLQYLLGAGAGSLVGFSLGLMGGGGSILAVPLMIYLVGVQNPHVAIGTSAFKKRGRRHFTLGLREVVWVNSSVFIAAAGCR